MRIVIYLICMYGTYKKEDTFASDNTIVKKEAFEYINFIWINLQQTSLGFI